LNGLTAQVQNFATGTSGADFGITSATDTHTFNLPTASATNRGALSSGDWTTFNGKFNTPTGTTAEYIRGDGTLATFPTIPSGTVTNVSATVPSPASPALSVNVSNPTTTPAIAITANGTTGQYIRGDGSLAAIPFELVVAASDETTALTAGNAKITFRMPRAVTLTAVRASLTTAQASGNIFTVDINEGGTSILSTKLTIDNTEKTSTTAATPPVISDTALADDAEMTIDIDQIGNGTATGLKVALIGVYA
jgi:hypothetical protein